MEICHWSSPDLFLSPHPCLLSMFKRLERQDSSLRRHTRIHLNDCFSHWCLIRPVIVIGKRAIEFHAHLRCLLRDRQRSAVDQCNGHLTIEETAHGRRDLASRQRGKWRRKEKRKEIFKERNQIDVDWIDRRLFEKGIRLQFEMIDRSVVNVSTKLTCHGWRRRRNCEEKRMSFLREWSCFLPTSASLILTTDLWSDVNQLSFLSLSLCRSSSSLSCRITSRWRFFFLRLYSRLLLNRMTFFSFFCCAEIAIWRNESLPDIPSQRVALSSLSLSCCFQEQVNDTMWQREELFSLSLTVM